jgi:hypothetical protein
MRKPETFLYLGLGLVLGAGFAGLAVAHPTGQEIRTVADCARLPGTDQAGERSHCIRCVTRPRPHHFHPEYPPGERCRPDNGKP